MQQLLRRNGGMLRLSKLDRLSTVPFSLGYYFQRLSVNSKFMRNDQEITADYVPLGNEPLTDREKRMLKQEIVDRDIQHLNKLTFNHLGIDNFLVKRLRSMQLLKPTPIQCLAIPPILEGYDAIIESPSGSGKTLAFLLPALCDSKLPYSTVIIVPTRELATQIKYHANRIEIASEINTKLHTYAFVSGVDMEEQQTILTDTTRTPRIIVGTGKRLKELIDSHGQLFSNTKRIIIDEIDRILMPLKKYGTRRKTINRQRHRKAADLVCEVLQKKSTFNKVQLICASATVVPELVDDLNRLGWDDTAKYLSYGIPSTVNSTVKHQLVLFKADNNNLHRTKIRLVAQFLRQSAKNRPALVIIHRQDSVTEFVAMLKQYNLNAIALFEMTTQAKDEDFDQFLNDFKKGKIDAVITNEESVRGLDFVELRNVIMIDVAKNVNEYLHIAGRVGRMNEFGTATTLVNVESVSEHKRQMLHYSRLGVRYSTITI